MEAITGLNHPPPAPDSGNATHDDLLALRESYETLQSKSSLLDENLLLVQQQRDEAIHHNTDLKITIYDISLERDSLREQIREFEASFRERENELTKRIDEEFLRKQEVEKEVEFAMERIQNLELQIKEAERKLGFFLKILDCIRPVKDCLVEVIECLDDEKVIERVSNDEGSVELEFSNECSAMWDEFSPIARLASDAKAKVNEFKEKRKNEKRELENSIVSLTEENRDINSLFRVALLEKEAAKKSLNKLKGNNEQKRVALLQIAERRLQRVGFGFMMGSGTPEQSVESSGVTTATAYSSS